METALLCEQNVKKGESITLISPRNSTPADIIYLSNIDQTVAFNVETVFFYEVSEVASFASDNIIEVVKQAVSEGLLIPYYFMAGRLRHSFYEGRLELICNNKGALFVGAQSSLSIKELGNLALPNSWFRLLIALPAEGFQNLDEVPVFTIQVTRFQCGGFSIGFVMNHSLLDGRSAAEMFLNLASICRGDLQTCCELNTDRSYIKARNPPLIKFHHTEYTTKLLPESSAPSSFTSPNIMSPQPAIHFSRTSNFKLFSFDADMIRRLKIKSEHTKCSTFEAVVAHLWRARTKAVFNDPTEISSVLFAVDIRSKMSPPLPQGFIGNAVVTASASAQVIELGEKSFSFSVGLVEEAIGRVNDEYARSVIDWLEVYKGVPSAVNGNFFVSAWWKLPFHELDFGYGKPIYGGPVVGGMEEFVLLLSDGRESGKGNESGVNVWIALDQEKMHKFQSFVFEI